MDPTKEVAATFAYSVTEGKICVGAECLSPSPFKVELQQAGWVCSLPS